MQANSNFRPTATSILYRKNITIIEIRTQEVKLSNYENNLN